MRMSAREKQELIANLATMLTAGIPILDSVDTLLEDSVGSTRKVLQLFKASLKEGHPISHAMRGAPRVFDAVTVNVIEAAESAGTLEEALHELAVSIKRDMAFNDQVKGSLLYPAFIFVIFAAVLLVILIFVVPRIATVFVGMRVQLPVPTQILINTSNFLLAYYPYIIAGAVVVIVMMIVLFRTKKRAIINLLLNLPLVTKLGRMIDLAHFARSMNQLLRAGVPVAEALELSTKVVTKREIAAAVHSMYESVSAGKPLAEGLVTSKHILPPMMLRILETAEQTGTLETTMGELAEYAETQVTRMLKTITTLIEPVMIVLVAVLVGGMMLAIIAPIYNIISQVNQR